uniref:FYVE-type domain-containing protein n=1 Tax=Globisporangium ultimum (strain ATCC 200006 / CBS 805.95 / DAOM BR144) TaxID=431595 RepID=K3WV02_GLOUD
MASFSPSPLPPPPPPQTLSAVNFAEKYEYANLVRTVQLQPALAQEVDDFGMTPLHWICTDPRVPLRVVQKLVLAHPAATSTKNLVGLLPFHIALRKNLPLDALKLLLKFYPKAITTATPDRRTPLELADELVTSQATKLFLQMFDAEVRALSRVATASKKQQKRRQLDHTAATATTSLPPRHERSDESAKENDDRFNNGEFASARSHKQRRQQNHDSNQNENDTTIQRKALTSSDNNNYETNHNYSKSVHDPITEVLNSPTLRSATQHRTPLMWKHDKRCHICECKFTYFRSRHHCRNCGESVCGRHSRNTLPLRHMGMYEPQRVCAVCHEHLQNSVAGCNTNEMHMRSISNASSGGRQSSDMLDLIDSPCSTRSVQPFMLTDSTRPRNGSTPFEMFPSASSSTTSRLLKRSKSVRNYLLMSPRTKGRMQQNENCPLDTATTMRGQMHGNDGDRSPMILSPARNVRSETPLRRNHSYTQFARLPLFPSTSSMFLSTVQVAPETKNDHSKRSGHDSNGQRRRKKSTSSKHHGSNNNDDERQHQMTSSSRGRQPRLVKTELDSPSKAWYEELDSDGDEDLDDVTSSIREAQKLSMDSHVEELEEHVQKLLRAKQKIGEALKQSQWEIHMAKVEKEKYDAIAQKYLDHGYAAVMFPSASSSTLKRDTDASLPDDDEDSDEQGKANRPGVAVTRPLEKTKLLEDKDAESDSHDVDTDRSTADSEFSVAAASSGSMAAAMRPSSPLPMPSLTPFRSEKLALHIPLDVAATHHELGVVLLGKGDFASAASEFEKALAIDSDNAFTWYHLAKALDGKGDLDAAEAAVKKALERDADSLSSLSLLGRLLHLRGEHDEAIVVFRQALKLQTPPVY